MKFIIQENFKKVRITKKDPDGLKIQELYQKRSKLMKSAQEMTPNDREIAEKIFERNRSIIVQQISDMSDASSNFSRVKMWKVKQKVCPKYEVDPPAAKIDSFGNLITNHNELKNCMLTPINLDLDIGI